MFPHCFTKSVVEKGMIVTYLTKDYKRHVERKADHLTKGMPTFFETGPRPGLFDRRHSTQLTWSWAYHLNKIIKSHKDVYIQLFEVMLSEWTCAVFTFFLSLQAHIIIPYDTPNTKVMDLIKQRCNNSNAFATEIGWQTRGKVRWIIFCGNTNTKTLGFVVRLPVGVTNLFVVYVWRCFKGFLGEREQSIKGVQIPENRKTSKIWMTDKLSWSEACRQRQPRWRCNYTDMLT